jgi:hypothetical protein
LVLAQKRYTWHLHKNLSPCSIGIH